jgi:hypothetical protein
MREVRFQRALFGRYLNATPMPSWTNGTFGQWRAIHASAAGLFSPSKVSFGRSSPITSCTLRTFLDRPRLIMWSRPAMLGSIRKRASVWRGPVRSSFPLGVPQRHYTCSDKILKVTALQALRDYCVAVIKSFLRKFHFWKWGRRKWADCRRPAYGGDIAPTCAAPHATTICRSKSTNAPWAIRRGSGSCPHRSSFRTLLRQF